MNDEEIREEVESALMHFCELAVSGDPEEELGRATEIVFDLIKSRDHQIALAVRFKLAQEFVQAGKVKLAPGMYETDNEQIGRYVRKKFLSLVEERGEYED